VAVKIKLKRLGKIRNPQYRIVVADSRTARDGRAIEEIGVYQPKQEPSLIQVDSARAQYWLGVGAQPTEAVMVLLKITGDWQKFKGLPGAEGTLRVAEPKPDRRAVFAEVVAAAALEPKDVPAPKRKKDVEAEAAAAAAAVEAEAAAAAETAADEATDAAAEATEAAPAEEPAAEATEAAAEAPAEA
jgi:small subunit ribosomal protein S16